MSCPLAITGATGRLGGRVARLLAGAGVPQRLVVRDAGRGPDLAAHRWRSPSTATRMRCAARPARPPAREPAGLLSRSG